ncbi:hypothetical protein [Frankia sp. AiPa1]|uniref:hypothetical protein n=1 Tax=Frankia sp. AiPa1 TaxID=573492 RepID=UPI00202B711D|nr:hypothetical protein [Frankia sp. AiPa1]MCL9759814.1 hypothetical protein [Frankia sp. AiPa1]
MHRVPCRGLRRLGVHGSRRGGDGQPELASVPGHPGWATAPGADNRPQPGYVAAWYGRPEVEPSRGGDATLQTILAELRRKTLTMAAEGGTLEASCDNDRIVAVPQAANHCSTVYNGLRIDWTVGMGGYDPPGSDWLTYGFSPPSVALLTATNVYEQVWKLATAVPGFPLKDPRCDVIPAAVLVKIGATGQKADTGYRCQYLADADNDAGHMRRDLRVLTDDEGQTTVEP